MWTSSPTLSPSSGDFLFEVASLEGLTGLFNFFFSPKHRSLLVISGNAKRGKQGSRIPPIQKNYIPLR